MTTRGQSGQTVEPLKQSGKVTSRLTVMQPFKPGKDNTYHDITISKIQDDI